MNVLPASKTQSGRRGLPRLFTIAFLGPAVGSLLMLLVLLLMSGVHEEPDFWDMLLRFTVFVFMIGYMAGSAPSIVSALVWHFGISRLESVGARIALSIATGAITGSLLVWPAIELMFGTWAPDAHFYAFTAGAGAIALLATAQPWREG